MERRIENIIYVKGDATDPIYLFTNEIRIIVHICNDINRWGKGFVMALSSRWPTIDQIYHKYSQVLGTIQPLIQIKEDLFVCNMIAQSGIQTKNNIPPIRYDALHKCLLTLVNLIFHNKNFKCFYSYAKNRMWLSWWKMGKDGRNYLPHIN